MSETTSKPHFRLVKPVVDIFSADEVIQLWANMPGVTADQIEVTLDQNMLTLHGNDVRRNYRYERVFRLTAPIDRDGISAEIKEGVLRVKMPLLAKEKPVTHQIAVTTA